MDEQRGKPGVPTLEGHDQKEAAPRTFAEAGGLLSQQEHSLRLGETFSL